MVELNKYGKALNALKHQRTTHNDPTAAPQPVAKANRGGKRSDPDYSPTTFFVRKDTKRKAIQLLLDGVAPEKDLSGLVQGLLAKWVSEHSHV